MMCKWMQWKLFFLFRFVLICYFWCKFSDCAISVLSGVSKKCIFVFFVVAASIVITATTTTSPYPALNTGDRTTKQQQQQQVYPVAQTSSLSAPTAPASCQQQEQANFLWTCTRYTHLVAFAWNAMCDGYARFVDFVEIDSQNKIQISESSYGMNDVLF